MKMKPGKLLAIVLVLGIGAAVLPTVVCPDADGRYVTERQGDCGEVR